MAVMSFCHLLHCSIGHTIEVLHVDLFDVWSTNWTNLTYSDLGFLFFLFFWTHTCSHICHKSMVKQSQKLKW